MQILQKPISGEGIKFYVEENGKEVGRAYLYILKNDLHKEPFGFMEDVYIDESQRGKGLGTGLVNTLIEEAKKRGCYKIVATSRHERPKVHKLYERLEYHNHGVEFRMDLLEESN